jgi:hypothetical protein
VAALLDPETPVPGVTAGQIRAALRPVGTLHKEGGGQIDPGAGDLRLTAGWGYLGKDGAVMPGRGRVLERPPTAAGRRPAGGDEARPPSAAPAGQSTLDVFLNDRVRWQNIPRAAWDFTIGGYQVLKKWLSYREHSLLGRPLTLGEAEYVTAAARRLTALAGMAGRLDANFNQTTGR